MKCFVMERGRPAMLIDWTVFDDPAYEPLSELFYIVIRRVNPKP